jgi:hypothetical protein
MEVAHLSGSFSLLHSTIPPLRLECALQLLTTPAVLPAGVEKLSGYIIPSEDAHASEYIADCDCRRAFISGFTGSKVCIAVHLPACPHYDPTPPHPHPHHSSTSSSLSSQVCGLGEVPAPRVRTRPSRQEWVRSTHITT